MSHGDTVTTGDRPRVSATLVKNPAAIAVTVLPSSDAGTSVWPSESAPQAVTRPSEVRARLCWKPAAIAVTVFPSSDAGHVRLARSCRSPRR